MFTDYRKKILVSWSNKPRNGRSENLYLKFFPAKSICLLLLIYRNKPTELFEESKISRSRFRGLSYKRNLVLQRLNCLNFINGTLLPLVFLRVIMELIFFIKWLIFIRSCESYIVPVPRLQTKLCLTFAF